MTTRTVEDDAAVADAMTLLTAVGVAILGLVVALASADAGMAFHGLLFLVAGAIAAMAVLHISFHDDSVLETTSPYYFVPKRVERPVYSYRLSIVHFWSLIFLYIWAGPHHLHYTALPDWAQTLGMTFSIMLWMPSWGGMINGLMTLSGAWDKLRTDPVVRLLVVSVAFYGMSTFEGR